MSYSYTDNHNTEKMSIIPDEIIIRSLQQTASAEDVEILNHWLKEDRKNVAYYFQLEEIWSSKEKVSEEAIHENWKRLSIDIEALSNKEMHPIQSRQSTGLNWLRYIAAVFIGICIASVIWMNMPSRQYTQEPEVIVQNTVYNLTGVKSVLLPDSSEVWLNENTQITYPEKFSSNLRKVVLDGKAFFDIRKNQEKPFIVRTGITDVEVTGTAFLVESAQNEETLVTLISGGVNLIHKDKDGKEEKTALIPGQQATINKSSGAIYITHVDTYYYIAWKDGIYRFNDEPLDKIIGSLAKRFDLNIQIASSLKNKRFTGRVTFEDNILDFLSTISKSYPIKYKITGNTIQIHEN